MRAHIMRMANALCDMLEMTDEEFCDKVISYVMGNERFDDDEIEAAEEAADNE